ncbi:hypothetical protein [Massilia glaciei]|uniref:hypothetical protein n=1 Tax=Massilia glaciei TaxID=1524097 RepID=UPI0011B23E67|nr:hypothetical protein [Massilia glaciei]
MNPTGNRFEETDSKRPIQEPLQKPFWERFAGTIRGDDSQNRFAGAKRIAETLRLVKNALYKR